MNNENPPFYSELDSYSHTCLLKLFCFPILKVKLKMQTEEKQHGIEVKRLSTSLPKIRHSLFFVTISSNKSDLNKEAQDEFYKNVCNILLKKCSDYIMFKVDGHKFSPVFLKSIAIGPGCLEQAPKTGYYHVHCIVKISHYSSVHLRPDVLTELVNKRTSYSCYVNVQWCRYTSKGQDLQNLLNYMKKNDQPKPKTSVLIISCLK